VVIYTLRVFSRFGNTVCVLLLYDVYIRFICLRKNGGGRNVYIYYVIRNIAAVSRLPRMIIITIRAFYVEIERFDRKRMEQKRETKLLRLSADTKITVKNKTKNRFSHRRKIRRCFKSRSETKQKKILFPFDVNF